MRRKLLQSLALSMALALSAPIDTEAPAHADDYIGPVTYTVEPFLGGSFGANVTQQQFGGRYCPCVAIPYTADGFHNDEGVNAIRTVAGQLMKPGDRLMGFSLGVQVISLYLAHNELPSGVSVLLAGDTFARNQELIDQDAGIPWDIDTPVTMVVNEYDGWSDKPTNTKAPGYWLALQNAVAGTQRLHYYANTDLDAPENVTTKRGNITAKLVPTQYLPANYYLRGWADTIANALDNASRDVIDAAYDRPHSSPEARLAATNQQVPQPNPAWKKAAEPAAGTKGRK